MATWELVPCGQQLRLEVNALAPNRDKTTDGTIGNAAHQLHISSHNDDEVGRVPIRDADSKHEVHAWDADKDLREPGLTMQMIVDHVVDRCRRGLEDRLRYVIYNRRICSASNGWKWRAYAGDNAHTEHAHFDFSYVTKLEADRRSWRLEDIPVAMTAADKNWVAEQIDKRADALEATILKAIAGVPAGVLAAKIGDPTNPNRSVANHLVDDAHLRGYLVAATDAKPGAISASAPVVQQTEAARKALLQ